MTTAERFWQVPEAGGAQRSVFIRRVAKGAPVATTFADLEARVRGLESRAARTEEDLTAIIGTVAETRDDVRWLRRAVGVLLGHQGLTVPGEDEDA